MVKQLTIDEYFNGYANLPLIDVRSPGEYQKGHIPGAHSIPLFTNDERAEIGTIYVHQSREKAIERGYQLVNPKLQHYINRSAAIAADKRVVVHCWRGGMRSASFAQHLADNDFREVYTIKGGYKAFRNHALKTFDHPFRLNVLGGYTGSGKTEILKVLQAKGEQVIDLEKLANHKGSAFGGIGQQEQPTVEQFENNLFEAFRQLDFNKPIWLEDESHNIGRVQIPINLFRQIRSLPLLFLDIPVEERTNKLVAEYGQCKTDELAGAIQRIHKRLGGLAVKTALQSLEAGDLNEVTRIALFYYDKAYQKGMNARDRATVITIALESTNAEVNAAKILQKTTHHV
ncbi:tRNA 2-selenouridine(34) synthase MnmH [Mangrovibacterium marinum]|uniref:tRNA 2-selenouridine synthase n=1 Tax=Mangrovibacterium marinum TaxID=1639118 RepID=A0A2T5C614_9BACT|nr:tRNA 2-selenouridine(34) synthase MnmH [Mangrovibacterium marinum]PTN10298.1 tRNA 2-selenouridine synthase [Mangrovibacterium marinum]